MKVAFITGITGQDGAYLSQFLLSKNYKVIGITRSYNNSNLSKLKYLGIDKQVQLEECDLADIPVSSASFKNTSLLKFTTWQHKAQ